MTAYLSQLIARALAESPTSPAASLTSPDTPVSAELRANDNGILAGRACFDAVFAACDDQARVTWSLGDGERVRAGTAVARINTECSALTAAEGAALDLLALMSGIAGTARDYVERVKGTRTEIAVTRHALPGLRDIQCHAAQCGRAIIPDASRQLVIGQAHRVAAGDVSTAVGHARQTMPDAELIVDVDSLETLESALEAGVDAVVLVDLASHVLARAVNMAHAHRRRFRSQLRIEATGAMSLATVREIADTGVDRIGVPALTRQLRAPGFELSIV